MNDTPRTDAESYQISKEAIGLIMTPIKIARQLERELNAAHKRTADELNAQQRAHWMECEALRNERDAARAELTAARLDEGALRCIIQVARAELEQAQSERDEQKRKTEQLRLDKLALSNQLQEARAELHTVQQIADQATAGNAELQKRLEDARAELATAREILLNVGLSPTHHQDTVKAAEGASSIISELRRTLSDPPPDVQEHVLTKLGIYEKLSELAALKASAPEPLDRPESPGWWWVWDRTHWDTKFVSDYMFNSGVWLSAQGVKWLPATPPPVPEKEVES